MSGVARVKEPIPTGKALFLDRDGTVIEHIPYLSDPDQVRLAPGARVSLEKARQGGFRLFLFTNQSGIGRGYFSESAADACNQRMFELLGMQEGDFSGICMATEAPGQPSLYRKPSPRFIEEMIEQHVLDPDQCWMIGDSECDREAARNAGIRFLEVGPGMPFAEAVEKALVTTGTA